MADLDPLLSAERGSLEANLLPSETLALLIEAARHRRDAAQASLDRYLAMAAEAEAAGALLRRFEAVPGPKIVPEPEPAPGPVFVAPEDRIESPQKLLARMFRGVPEPAAPSAPEPVKSGPDLPTEFGVRRLRFKAQVARMREDLSFQDDTVARDATRAMIERHVVEFNKQGYVYGLGSGHRMAPEEWARLADVYERTADASEALLADPALARSGAFGGVAGAIAALFARARVPAGGHLLRDEDVAHLFEATGEQTVLGSDLELLARTDRLGAAVEAGRLARALTTLRADLRRGDDAAGAFERGVAAGLSPEEREVRALLLDHLDEIEESETLRPIALRLHEELQREADREEATEAENDPNYARMREEVRRWTAGKTLLVLGGETRPEAAAAIREELGLADVDWPNSDPATNLDSFFPHVDRADIVAHLAGFSRKGYKLVARYALDRDRLVVKLWRGYNPRRIVAEFHRQIIEPRETHP